MKKRRILSILLSYCLLLTILAACGSGDTAEDPTPTPPPDDAVPTTAPPAGTGEIYTVDFSDGNMDFLKMNLSAIGANPDATMEIATIDGGSALKLSSPNGKGIFLGINVDGLLGSSVGNVRTIIADVYAEYPDGNFSAVGGTLTARDGDMAVLADKNWTVYLESRNPNQATLDLGADSGFDASGNNILEFSCISNGPADKGETPANIYIQSITFYDASSTGLAVNTSAGWAIEGYGDNSNAITYWSLPVLEGEGWVPYYTFGTDDMAEIGVDNYMPWTILANSYGIVFEVAEKPGDGDCKLAFQGDFNDWGWNEISEADFAANWEDGKVTILWDDFDVLDMSLLSAEGSAAKIMVGNWNGISITSTYLLISDTGSYWQLPDLEGEGWVPYQTFGTDESTDNYMPWTVLANSYGIVFEIAEQPGGGDCKLAFQGDFNDWGWNEISEADFAANWEDGKVTILWDDFDVLDMSLLSAEANAAKIMVGNWNGIPITTAYLLINDGSTSYWSLPVLEGEGFVPYQTFGTDESTDDYMPWTILANSYGIVFEIAEQPGGGDCKLAFQGDFNDWGWNEISEADFAANWEDGKVTILWDDLDVLDMSLLSAEGNAAKIMVGNWNGIEISAAYLLIG